MTVNQRAPVTASELQALNVYEAEVKRGLCHQASYRARMDDIKMRLERQRVADYVLPCPCPAHETSRAVAGTPEYEAKVRTGTVQPMTRANSEIQSDDHVAGGPRHDTFNPFDPDPTRRK